MWDGMCYYGEGEYGSIHETGTVVVGEKFGAYYYLIFNAAQHREIDEQGEQVNLQEKGGFGLHAYYDDKGRAQITGYTRIR